MRQQKLREQINLTITLHTCKISAEDESNDSKYTVFNCVKSNRRFACQTNFQSRQDEQNLLL